MGSSALAIGLALLMAAPAGAQSHPRTPWGDPDLQGTWTTDEITRQPGYQVFEYACHEGNYGMRNILSGARADEAAK
jgi:hypothetical protein